MANMHACSWLAMSVAFACLYSAARPALAQTTGTFDNKLLCMADMVSNVEDSCSKGAGQAYYTELEDLLKRYLGQCFNTNFTGRALHLMLPDISPQATAWLNAKADQFKSLQGIEVVTTFVPYKQINVEIEFELGNNLTYMHDGWILDPMAMADIYNLKGFLDLRPLVSSDPTLAWSDVLPFFDTKAGVYDDSLVVMPMDGHVELLYYKKDLFTQYNLAVPTTWDDMLATALLWNQTLALQYNASSPNATVPYAVCLERRKACGVGSFQLLAVAAPYLQYTGASQGVVFDPALLGIPTAQQALDSNAAMLRALTIYSNLSAMSPPYGVDDACNAPFMSAYFAAGQCLMTIGLSDVFKATNSTVMRDNVGVAPAPGSYQVLDRTTQQLATCTAALCPYAEAVITKNGSSQLLNRAPFAAGGGWVAAVNARSAELYQNYSYAFFSFINSPDSSFESLTTPGLIDFSPYRRQHFTNLSAWTNANFSAQDTTAFLAAGLRSLSHANMALDLRVEPSSGSTTQPSGTKSYRDVYNNGVANVTAGSAPAAAMAQMATDMAAMLSNPQMTNLAVLSSTYRLSIHYVPPSPPAGPAAGNSGSHLNWVPIAIVLPVVCTLLLIAAGVVYEIRNARKHKNLLGKVIPPGVGADTTILITDIQDSAPLWEALPVEVMDKALKEHNECIRKLLSRHSGYESATEGESFILAFHSPKDALLFAMEAQEALLHVEWPQELLDVPLCAPVYVQGTSTKESRPKHLQDILDGGDPVALSPTGSLKAKALLGQESSVDSLSRGLNDGLGGHSPAIPALVNVPLSEVCSFAAACHKSWTEVTNKDDPNKVLIFRGLRVRMGVHAGIHNAADVTRSRADKRTHYSGETITLGRAVSDASHGGMVLISEETYKKLPLERLWVKYLVLHVGEHKLTEALPNLNLYHALNRTLEGRLAYLGPQRTLNQIDPGVLEAPVGCITVAFMNVVGAQTLLSWNADVAQHALKTFHSVVGEELKKRRGYLVEAVDGLFLAAFQSPVEAILWALQCNEDMVKQDWPELLLSHELCEELTIGQPKKNTKEIVNITVFRGLRLKTGVDTGQVLGEVHAMTGRMTYRGKVMNRAARIAGTSSTGQVLASVDSWTLAVANDKAVLAVNKINSMSLGHFRLKGVADRIEVFHCRKVVTQALQPDDDDDGDDDPKMMGIPGSGGSQHWKWDQQMHPQTIGPEDIVLGPSGGKVVLGALALKSPAAGAAGGATRHGASLATNDTDEVAASGSDADGCGTGASGRISGLKVSGDGKATATSSGGSPSSDDHTGESLQQLVQH